MLLYYLSEKLTALLYSAATRTHPMDSDEFNSERQLAFRQGASVATAALATTPTVGILSLVERPLHHQRIGVQLMILFRVILSVIRALDAWSWQQVNMNISLKVCTSTWLQGSTLSQSS